jgi:signal transduction histidine kinase
MSGASPATEPAGRTFWDRASQYAFAIAAVAAACGVKLIVGHWLADADSLFLAAVSITAWRAGVAPGLLAVILSSLSQAYFFLAPYYSISIASAEEAVQLGLWSAEAALLCFLFGALRAARSRALHSASDAEAKQNLLVQSEDRLRSAHDALERRVEERTSELASANANLVREADERDRVQRELERSEGQFRQLQKMEAVSRLAGGVAHDFNNLLSVILSYGEMALSDLKPGEPPSEELTEIVKAGKRAADLTRQLLLFSRQQVVAPKILHLGEVLLGMEKMLRRLVGEDVELTCKGTASLRRVEADPGSIEQVIMNLVVNARDAMPTGGKLTIETSDALAAPSS